ncbi:MAG TPA: DUF1674 domain-containing protein [Rhizomicrobium sp.]|jgi:hypothetical protein|nr:DUF1674 domain-containing protein [Rhizomicrobium sp.]
MSKDQSKTGKNARVGARIREAALRARAEAEARRRADKQPSAPKEIGGAEGPEPTRYGDWERKGVISDF